MMRTRIAGAALLVLLCAGVFSRVANRAGVPSRKAEPIPMATGMVEGPADIVDPKTGNVHLEIPIRAVRQKTGAPRSGH